MSERATVCFFPPHQGASTGSIGYPATGISQKLKTPLILDAVKK